MSFDSALMDRRCAWRCRRPGGRVAKTPVHSVISLVVNILALAALYLSLNAEFMALIQVIVYAGAIMILFLFVIALLTARKDPVERREGKLEGQRELGVHRGDRRRSLDDGRGPPAGLGRPSAQDDLAVGLWVSAAAFGRELSDDAHSLL